jgi:hypothetical protein
MVVLLLALLSGSFVLQCSLSIFIELEVIQDRCLGRKALENIQHANCLFKLDLTTQYQKSTH